MDLIRSVIHYFTTCHKKTEFKIFKENRIILKAFDIVLPTVSARMLNFNEIYIHTTHGAEICG